MWPYMKVQEPLDLRFFLENLVKATNFTQRMAELGDWVKYFNG